MNELKERIRQLNKRDAIITVNNEEQMKEIETFIRHNVYYGEAMTVKYTPSLTMIDTQIHCINIMIVKCKAPSIYILSRSDDSAGTNIELRKLTKDLQELTAKYNELAEKIIDVIDKI